jgi:hypothetical protein
MFRKPSLYLSFVGLALSIAAIGPANAGSPPKSFPATAPVRRVIFKPPVNERSPDRAIGAGSRGTGLCAIGEPTVDTPPLTALVPPDSIGRTVAERPVFWVHVPSGTAKRVALSVTDEDGGTPSFAFFDVPEQSGLVRLQLPSDAPPLEIGKTYRWAIVLVCGDRQSPNDPSIAGLVTRVSLSETPSRGDLMERARWYGERGIWYEALESLILAWQKNPDARDIPAIWSEFLRSAGLSSLADRPRPF